MKFHNQITMQKNRFPLQILLICLLACSACIREELPEPPKEQRVLKEILQNNFAFSMFYQALQRTGLDTITTSSGSYTLLLPDNDAFARSGINADSLSRIDKATLEKMLRYHIIRGALPSAAIPQAIDYGFVSMAGPMLYTSVPMPWSTLRPSPGNPMIHVNGVNVNKADIMASNGVIHALEKVLNYPAPSVKSWLENAPAYSRFVKALKKFGMFEALATGGPVVVLAPSNDVFDKWGLDDATLETMDTLHYRKMLFNNYLLPARFFFKSDFKDAPMQGSVINPPVLILKESILLVENERLRVLPLDYQRKPEGILYTLGETVDITNSDYLCTNGVVHGINGLMVLPDSVKIK